jgi:hypothetical protein
VPVSVSVVFTPTNFASSSLSSLFARLDSFLKSFFLNRHLTRSRLSDGRARELRPRHSSRLRLATRNAIENQHEIEAQLDQGVLEGSSARIFPTDTDTDTGTGNCLFHSARRLNRWPFPH